MTPADAAALIATAVPRGPGTWADLGAGHGVFTRALVRLLGPGSRIYAVDRDAGAVAALRRLRKADAVDLVPVAADFTRPFELPALPESGLDGMLFANALHFVQDPEVVMARLVGWLKPGGRVVLVEYDGRTSSRWVPHPIPSSRLPALAASAGLSAPTVTATRPSAFGGVLYVAAADRSR